MKRSLLALLALALVLGGWTAPTWAVTAGPNYAGAAGTNSFTLPANAVGSTETTCAGDNYGTSIVSGFWNTFGFAIPSGATIDGIQVEVKMSANSDPAAIGDVGINVGTNETTLGTEKTNATLMSAVACGAGQAIWSFGGPADKWGLTWTPADINAAAFTVRIRKSILGSEHGLNINWIRVTVTYTVLTCAAVPDAAYVAANAQIANGQVTVYWSTANPVVILRKSGAFAGEAPVNGTTYTAGQAVGAATVAWVGSGTSFLETPAPAGNYYYKVFAYTAGPCYSGGAVNTADGVSASTTTPARHAWSYAIVGGGALAAPIAGDTTLYTPSNAGQILSLNTANGTQKWLAATNAAVQSWLSWIPGATGGSVVAGDQGTGVANSARVYYVDALSGAQNFGASISGPKLGNGADSIQAAASTQLWAYSNAAFQSALQSLYAYSGDVVFVATKNSSTTNNTVYALKATDGTVLWNFNTASANPSCPCSVDWIIGQPAADYARNRLYVASRAGSAGTQASLWVLDTTNGALVTSFALGHLQTSPSVSWDGQTLWVANVSGQLYAINLAATPLPTLKWTAPLDLGGAVAKINDTGFVWEDYVTAGRLYFSTADGNVWCWQDPGPLATPNNTIPCSGWAAVKTSVPGASSSVLLLDKLFVGGTGQIYQLNPGTGTSDPGTPVAVGDPTKKVGDPSSETGNEIFVGTEDGRIFKFNLTGGSL